MAVEYINAIGRRKSAVARVYLTAGTGKITLVDSDFARTCCKVRAKSLSTSVNLLIISHQNSYSSW